MNNTSREGATSTTSTTGGQAQRNVPGRHRWHLKSWSMPHNSRRIKVQVARGSEWDTKGTIHLSEESAAEFVRALYDGGLNFTHERVT